MILTLVNVLYVLIAVAMTALILLQRGAGAAAGSGFGAGASATVFGARGASNFLSKSTAVLAALFFALSLGMAYYATKTARGDGADVDLGVMGGTAAPASEVPSAPAGESVPAATVAPTDVPAAATVAPAPSDVPATTTSPAAEGDEDDKGG
jgi:preprotein translocase subunit SecG